MSHQRRFHAALSTVIAAKWRNADDASFAALHQVADAAAAPRDEPLTTDELSAVAAFPRNADPYPTVASCLLVEILCFPNQCVIRRGAASAHTHPAAGNQQAHHLCH